MSEHSAEFSSLSISASPSQSPRKKELQALASPTEGIESQNSVSEEETSEESSPLEDLSDDEVHKKYQHHPGYPRTAAMRKRYYKFVYPLNDAETGDGEEQPPLITDHEEYRRELKIFYQSFVRSWFSGGDWARFPDVLNKEEYECLDAELKNKYKLFCERRKREVVYDDTQIFFSNKLAWGAVVAGYLNGELAPGQLLPSRK